MFSSATEAMTDLSLVTALVRMRSITRRREALTQCLASSMTLARLAGIAGVTVIAARSSVRVTPLRTGVSTMPQTPTSLSLGHQEDAQDTANG